MNCSECNSTDSKYKCPRCRVLYCSVNCCKKHQSVGCKPIELKEEITAEDKGNFKYETEDTVPLERLKLLETNKNLIDLLGNAYLRDLLVYIDKASNPERAIRSAMKDTVFVKFADECLRSIESMEDEAMQE